MEPEVQVCFLMIPLLGEGGNPPLRGERVLKTGTLLTLSFRAPVAPNCTLLSTQIPMYQGRLWEREEGKPGRGKTDEQTLRFCCLREVPTKASLGTHQSLGASQQDGEKRL